MSFTPEQIAQITAAVKAGMSGPEAVANATGTEVPTPAAQNPNSARFGRVQDAANPAQSDAVKVDNVTKIVIAARALASEKGHREAALERIGSPVGRHPGEGGYGRPALAEELTRAYQAQDPQYGGFLVPETWSDTIIELLQPNAILANVSPMEIPNPTGTYHAHRELTEPTAYWGPPEAPADSGVKASRGTFGGLTFTEKNLWAFLIFSNKLLRVARPAVDALAVRQLKRVFTKATDLASHFGTNSQYQPCGLFTDPIKSLCGSVTGGALPTSDTPIKFLVELLKNNAPTDNLHWTMPPALLGLFMQMRTDDGYLIYPETRGKNPSLLGYPVIPTTQIPVSGASHNPTKMTLGNWTAGYAVAPVRGLELAYTSEGSVPDENGTMRSMIANDETAVRMCWAGDMGPVQPKCFVLGENIWTTA